MNLGTPKAGAKCELLFNKLASVAGLLNKSSCFTPTLGVTIFTKMRDMILVTPKGGTKHELLSNKPASEATIEVEPDK